MKACLVTRSLGPQHAAVVATFGWPSQCLKGFMRIAHSKMDLSQLASSVSLSNTANELWDTTYKTKTGQTCDGDALLQCAMI